MKILVVSFFDDNFGDMLIRSCFKQILSVVLKNIGKSEFEIVQMDLKRPNEDLIRSSDVIFFAGGGLFGQSYLGFADSFELVLDIATKEGVPVIISSMGVNNMDGSTENELQLKNILNMDCIRFISVRENKELFERYTTGRNISVLQVCDPVVWARYVYSVIPSRERVYHKSVIGINVVRGGLFADNGYEWRFREELDYLKELRGMLRESGVDYCFYTNGSFLDNETLMQFVYENELSENEYTIVRTSKELINTIADFDAVASIRMHSSIVSYAMGIPAVNLVWNDKIPLFYKYIGKEDRVIRISDWNAKTVYNSITNLVSYTHEEPDKEYMMSLYNYLLYAISNVFEVEQPTAYTFEKICKELMKDSDLINEESIDTEYYIRRAEMRYSQLFRKNMEKKDRVNELKDKYGRLKDKYYRLKEKDEDRILSLNQKLSEKNIKIEEQRERIAELKDKVSKKNKKISEQKAELEWLNSSIVVKVYKKICKTPGDIKEVGGDDDE